MRIAIVSNLFPPVQTGSSFWASELACELHRAGNEVIVITCGNNDRVDLDESKGYSIYRLPFVRMLPRSNLWMDFEQFSLIYCQKNRDIALSILKERKIEIIHQSSHYLDSVRLTRFARKQLDIPAAISFHTLLHHPTNRLYDFVLRAADRLALGSLISGSYDLGIALDDMMRKHIDRTYNLPKVMIAPPPIGEDILRLPAAPVTRQGQLRIVSVGHLTGMRDRKELIVALSKLKKDGVDAHLSIIGKRLTANADKLLRQYGLEGTVDIMGEVPRQEIINNMKSYNAAAVWINMPGIGTAATEAMALGLPLLSYSYEGIYGEAPLKHGENIFFVDPKDIDGIASILKDLEADPELRGKVGAAARKLVEKHLVWPKIADNILKSYKETLAN